MFRIWYPHTTVEGDTSEDWAEAPAEGVQFVYQGFGRDVHGRPLGAICSGADHYWLHEGKIGSGVANNEPGTFVLYDGPASAVAKTGLWIEDEAFASIHADFLNWLEAHNATRED